MEWKLKFDWAFSFVKKGFKACQDSLWQLFTSKTEIWQICSNRPGKKCPRVPVWVRGGVQSLKGQCPNAFGIFFGAASLSPTTFAWVEPEYKKGRTIDMYPRLILIPPPCQCESPFRALRLGFPATSCNVSFWRKQLRGIQLRFTKCTSGWIRSGPSV